MRTWIAVLVAALLLPVPAGLPAGAQEGKHRGSFVAHALPLPLMEADIYYPRKRSCLDGIDGVHKVSEPFRAPAAGALTVHIESLSGDWDVYVLGTRNEQLGVSDNAQLLDGAKGEEQLTVRLRRNQRVQMVACNWLGEPEVTVHFEFVAQKAKAKNARSSDSGSAARQGNKRTTHRVDAAGGPITPLWEWDPSELEVSAGDKVVWRNETGSAHHLTPYEGPWKDVDTKHLPIDGKVGSVFRKPGEYLYRCDFAFAGIEHSLLVGDECIGMCGRIVVKKRR